MHGTRIASTRGMHAVSFQMKRCHLSAVRLGRRILRGRRRSEDSGYDGDPDMTPARFDILYLVFGQGRPRSNMPGTIALATLRRLLGLARSTVSQAVKRLVQLGFVTCEWSSWSARNKVVTLTSEGWERFKKTLDLVFNERALSRHYQRYVDPPPYRERCPPWRPMRPWRNAQALRDVRDELESLARHLFDESAMLYAIKGEPDD